MSGKLQMKKKMTESEKLSAIQEELRDIKMDKVSLLTKKHPQYTEPLKALRTSSIIAASLCAAILCILLFGAIPLLLSPNLYHYYYGDFYSFILCMLLFATSIYIFELYLFIKIARFTILPSKVHMCTNIAIALNILLFISCFGDGFSIISFLLFAGVLGISIYIRTKIGSYEEWFNKL